MTGPIRFVKEHPVGFLLSAGVGMVAGPWALGTVQRYTGLSVSLPSFRASVRDNAG